MSSPGFSLLGTMVPDNLIAGDHKIVTQTATVSGTGTMSRGRLLARRSKTVPTDGTADVGNTGDGAMTTVTGGPATAVGTYTVTCITAPTGAGANDAVFSVKSPNGAILGEAVQGAAFENEQLGFTIGDVAGVDFIVGDAFTVAVTVPTGITCVDIDPTAGDGSAHPYGILADDIDLSSGDVRTVMYLTGQYNPNAMSVADGIDIATLEDELRAMSIFLVPVVGA
ncbi:hypothetical protein [Desulfovibrio inopinatus]|uniref:hypothetical protein n=1 Tax=Desulfovibrio inopinatus TaxID=102109 RepID=UPI0004267733|nr:hypothetical protein [Desulfovibrio inopinatus]